MSSQDKDTDQQQGSEKVPTPSQQVTAGQPVSQSSSSPISQPYSSARSHVQQEAPSAFFPPSPLPPAVFRQDEGYGQSTPRHLVPPLPVSPAATAPRRDSKEYQEQEPHRKIPR